jgi:hypothetical protein
MGVLLHSVPLTPFPIPIPFSTRQDFGRLFHANVTPRRAPHETQLKAEGIGHPVE